VRAVPVAHNQKLMAADGAAEYALGPFSKKKPHPSVAKLVGATMLNGKLTGGTMKGGAPAGQLDAYKKVTELGQMASPFNCTALPGLTSLNSFSACESAMEWMKSSGFKNGGAGVLADASVLKIDAHMQAIYPAGCLVARKVRKVKTKTGAQVTKHFAVMFNEATNSHCTKGCAESVGRICKKTSSR